MMMTISGKIRIGRDKPKNPTYPAQIINDDTFKRTLDRAKAGLGRLDFFTCPQQPFNIQVVKGARAGWAGYFNILRARTHAQVCINFRFTCPACPAIINLLKENRLHRAGKKKSNLPSQP